MLKKMGLFLALSLGAMSAHAESCDLFYGLDIGKGQLIADEAKIATGKDVQATLGCQFSDWIGVEGRISATADEYMKVIGDPIITRASALARLSYKGDRVLVYGLLGMGYANYDNSQVKKDDRTTIAPAYGLGLELFGGPRTAIHFGYTVQTVLNAKGSPKTNYGLTTLGYRYYFSDLF